MTWPTTAPSTAGLNSSFRRFLSSVFSSRCAQLTRRRGDGGSNQIAARVYRSTAEDASRCQQPNDALFQPTLFFIFLHAVFFAVWAQDLVFLNDGNPKRVEDESMINVEKISMMIRRCERDIALQAGRGGAATAASDAAANAFLEVRGLARLHTSVHT